MKDTKTEHTRRHEPVLGTVLELRLVGSAANTEAAEDLLLVEFERLENVFSAFAASSTLNLWRCGHVETTIDEELGHLLEGGLRWQSVSGGAFNPAAGILSDLWMAGEATQSRPGPELIASTVQAIRKPRYVVDGRQIRRTGDCSSLNLNAFAKGYIVDIAGRTVADAIPLESMIISAGGDLVHRGHGDHRIGIENPHRPYDNEPALCMISISNQAMATSGTARRGFVIGGERFGHVISPTTGEPTSDVVQASVLADDAATADVVATIVTVLGVEVGLEFVATLPNVGCFIVDRFGESVGNDRWTDQLVD